MSEFALSLLAGSMPMEAGQASSSQFSDRVDDSESSDFASLFDEMNFAVDTPEESALPDLTGMQSFISPMLSTPAIETENLAEITNDMSSPASSQQSGNSLPLTSPLVSILGFGALADQGGAAAISFQGDGKHILTSGPQYATSIAPAVQQSQAQLHNMIQPDAMNFQDAEILIVPKVDMGKQIEMLTSLAPQSTTAPTDTLMNMTSQQSGQALMGLQGVTEFSNVLAASTRSPEPMTATLNQPQWNHQVGDRINWMISQGLRQAEIRLNPPELGMLEVRVHLQGDQASIQFNTPHAEVKDVLDTALPRLREMLAENGLDLADVNVSQQGQQHARHSDEPDSKSSINYEHSIENDREIDSQEIKTITGNGVIDFYA